jgi:mannosyltransferase OCH1-like enzyme
MSDQTEETPSLIVKEINEVPLVSCLCVTQNKFELLEQSIECFLFQSHPNKELVVIFESNNTVTIEQIKARFAGEKSIVYVEVPIRPKKTLGELRNISIQACSGEYFMQWDDDDMYHPDRIRLQLAMAARGVKDPASPVVGNVVNCVVIYDQKLKRSFLFNNYKFDGSILVHKASFLDKKLTYPNLTKGEDSIVRNALLADGSLQPLLIPFMYLYRFHSSNTWDEAHFHGLYLRSVALEQAQSRLVAAANFLADPAFLKTVLQAVAMGKAPVFSKTVPKIIHQTWKSRNLPPHSAELTTKWKALHPGWTYKLWTDRECLDFVSAVFPEFERVYRNFPHDIQRFDAIRYLLLHVYGGVYLDLDMFPLKSLSFLETCTDFVISKEPAEAAVIHGREYIVSNAFMASPPQHRFLPHLVQDMATHRSSYKDRNNLILDTTGPFFMSRVYKRRPEGVTLLGPSYFMPHVYKSIDGCVTLQDSATFYRGAHDAYGVHMFEGSWWRTQPNRAPYLSLLKPVTAPSPIPKILHLTWKSKSLPPDFQFLVQKMAALHPDWQIRLWTDEEMMAFVKEKGAPHQFQKYSDYIKTIQCCDYFRVFVLYVMGGVYLDLDIDLDRSFDELPGYVNAFFPCEKVMSPAALAANKNRDAVRIGNYAMGAVPAHPFFKVLLDRLQSAKSSEEGPAWVLETTGPGLLTTVYHDYVKAAKNVGEGAVTILWPELTATSKRCQCESADGVTACRVGGFGAHLHAGTWRTA